MILAGLLACSILAAIPVRAAQVDWHNKMADDIYSTSYNWSTPDYWWGGVPPAANDDIGFHLLYPDSLIDSIPTTIYYDVSTPMNFNLVTVSNWDITPVTLSINSGYDFSADTVRVGYRGTLALHGGTLATTIERIDSQGYILQTSGVNTISDSLYLDRGTYELRDGALGARNERIEGSPGIPGDFLQTGGINTVGYELSLSDGTYSLIGGSLEAYKEIVGNERAGVFNQTGGTNVASDTLLIGNRAYGLYNLSGGTLAASDVTFIGYENIGRFNQSGGTNSLNTVFIGNLEGSSGSYDLSGGVFSANKVYVGHLGTGTFVHTGGTSNVGQLTIDANGATGTYRLEGTGHIGSPARLTAGVEHIGYSGTGAFDHYGSNDSVHTAGLLYIGYDTGGNGTYTMHGNVLLAAGDEVVGRAGNGSFTQHMGTNRIGAVPLKPGEAAVGTGTLTIGELLGGTGVYSMNPTLGRPELWASTEVIGNYGTGTFTQFGGTNTVAGDLYLGRFAGGSGSYALSGSGSSIQGVETPSTELKAFNEYIGDGGTGVFAHNGGNNTLSGDLYLGRSAGGAGSYTLSGSGGFYGSVLGGYGYTLPTELKAVNEYIGGGGTGTFVHNSGNNTLSGGLHVGGSGAGAYTLNGGNLYAANLWIGAGTGTGTFIQSGGNNNVSDFLTIGANGTYTLSGIDGPGSPASLTTGGIINNGTFNYSGGFLSLYRLPGGPPPYPPDPDFTNNGTLNISGTGERRFSSLVINNGTVKTTDTTVTFNGNFINNGAYISDPSTNIFSNLTIGATGYLVGALGDVFRINGDFIVTSLMNTEWNTSGALLEFSSGIHTLDLRGSTVDFHFGILQIDDGGYFSDASIGILSADVLNIYDFSGFLTEFQGNGIHINYGSLFAFNADGSSFDLTGEQLIRFASLGFLQAPGTQAPVPEPSTMLLLGSGMAGLVGYGRKRFKKN